MTPHRIGLSLLGAMLLTFPGWSVAQTAASESSLLSMHSGHGGAAFHDMFSNLREKAIYQAAETVGAQNGFCAGVQHWNDWALARQKILDKVR